MDHNFNMLQMMRKLRRGDGGEMGDGVPFAGFVGHGKDRVAVWVGEPDDFVPPQLLGNWLAYRSLPAKGARP